MEATQTSVSVEQPRTDRTSTLVALERWVLANGRLPRRAEVAALPSLEAHFGSFDAAMRQLRSVVALYHLAG